MITSTLLFLSTALVSPQAAPHLGGGGSARQVWIDFDEDGLLDLYTTAAGRADVLLRNLGDGGFAHVTEEVGLGRNSSQAALTADFDRDRRTDLLLVDAGGGLRLFRAAAGAFEEVSAEVGLGGAEAAVRAEWIDYDEDGWVDLWLERAGGQPGLFHNQAGLAFERVDLALPEVSVPALASAVVTTVDGASSEVGVQRAGAGLAVDMAPDRRTPGPEAKPRTTRRPLPRDPAYVGIEGYLASHPMEAVSVGGVAPLAFTCLPSIGDQSGGCILADSTPTLGRLYPQTAQLNVTSNNVNIGNTETTGFDLNVTSGFLGVKCAGINPPTNGYLGTNGDDDFDGVKSADWLGLELGVAGISTGGSSLDNYGVMGHANWVGVRGEHSENPSTDYGELGRAGVGVTASGSTLAGDFIGSVDVAGTLAVTGHVVTTTSEMGRPLDVQDEFLGNQVQVANIERTNASFTASDMLQIKAAPGSSTSAQMIEAQVDTDIEFRVDMNGDVFCDGTFVGGGADFAEMIRVSSGSGTVEPGDLLVIDPHEPRAVVKCSRAGSNRVAGVYSTKPGFVGSEREWDERSLAGPLLEQESEAVPLKMQDMVLRHDEVPMAVVGIVPVNATTEGGPIRPGDLLVSASSDGHVMRDSAPAPGTLVGKALEPLTSGTGQILVLLNLR